MSRTSRSMGDIARCALVIAALLLSAGAMAAAPSGDATTAPATTPAVAPAELVERGIAILLDAPEGEQKDEWPYEGVYRVRGEIPIGYRVGGTALAALALIEAPGYEQDERRRAAVGRAVGFVASSPAHPEMTHAFTSSYDVRGWGFACGLLLLARLEQRGLVPEPLASDAGAAMAFFVDGIAATAIPRRGGWNYARRGGFDEPGPPSPFMTALTLQALYEAAAAGREIDPTLVQGGLASLEGGFEPSGSVVYSGAARGKATDVNPGAIGRTLAARVAQHLAGRADAEALAAAVDAFFEHWHWLDERRAQHGTHAGQYGVAPYYFYFAHYYAAQAIELLPEAQRPERRARLLDLLLRVRLDDGGWNDRVFPRSRAYGTSMGVLALTMPEARPPARWETP